jgi:hypothetical protein
MFSFTRLGECAWAILAAFNFVLTGDQRIDGHFLCRQPHLTSRITKLIERLERSLTNTLAFHEDFARYVHCSETGCENVENAPVHWQIAGSFLIER